MLSSHAIHHSLVLHMEDVYSVILGFCDSGSDYKSWVLVCKVWMGMLTRSFPDPKWIFGNKLINVIDATDALSIINTEIYQNDLIWGNPYIPNSWKRENVKYLDTGDQKWPTPIAPTPDYTLEEMDRICTKNEGVYFTSPMLFYRPFKDEESVWNFFYELRDKYKFRFTDKKPNCVFHHTVPVKLIKELSELSDIEVLWDTIPITHHNNLSDDDWVILKSYVAPKSLNSRWWCSYPTTTVEEIKVFAENNYNPFVDFESNLNNTLGYIVRCSQLTQEQVISIIENNTAPSSWFWEGVFRKTFGTCYSYGYY